MIQVNVKFIGLLGFKFKENLVSVMVEPNVESLTREVCDLLGSTNKDLHFSILKNGITIAKSTGEICEGDTFVILPHLSGG